MEMEKYVEPFVYGNKPVGVEYEPEELTRKERFDTEGLPSFVAKIFKGTGNYSKVRFEIEVSDGDVNNLQLIAKDSVGNYYNIITAGWGPSTGFPLMNAETEVFVIAGSGGTYSITVSLINLEDDSVLASYTNTLVVVE